MYNLPKKYLSYSAYSLWKSSKEQFRKRYYLNEDPFETPETRFGKVIGAMVENNEHLFHEYAGKILNYPHKEYKIEVEVGGLKLLGYLDQFDDTEYKILEMKTGHKNKQGKVPWDRIKVQKHTQLVFYSLLVEKKFGKVHSEVILQWLETDFVDKTIEFDGHILSAKSRELQIISEPQTFKRKIHKWERVKLLRDILQTAEEISADYTNWIASRDHQSTSQM
jgi:hypothetical protein